MRKVTLKASSESTTKSTIGINFPSMTKKKERQMLEYIAKGKKVYIGLEDSLKTWKLCVRVEGLVVHEPSLEANYSILKQYLTNYPQCEIHVIYESGFRGFSIYDKLVADGYDCVVTPAHTLLQPKCFKVKTDKTDARLLAYALEHDGYKACAVPDKERRGERQLCRTLTAITNNVREFRARIRQELYYHDIQIDLGDDDDDEDGNSKSWTKATFRRLRNLKLSVELKLSFDTLLDMLEMLWDKKRILDAEVKKIMQKERYSVAFEIGKTLPGIGALTCARLLLELGENMQRFHSGKALAQFVGLATSEHSSGESIRRGRITGMGNKYIRSWLIESAWVAKNKDPVLLDFFNRVYRNCGNKKKAIVAVARKLIIRFRTCILNNESYVRCVVK